MSSVLLIGGSGPTGPYILNGLIEAGHDVTMLHTGAHEIDEVQHVPHLHGDVRSLEGLTDVLADREFDVVVATYGRLRAIAEVLRSRVGHLVSVGGAPAYRGYFNADQFDPPGLPVPTREHAPLAREDDDGKSYRIVRTEEIVFEHHPTATHFRYPYVYGPRQPVPREWAITRRILDGRPHIIVPDGGLTLTTFGYVENLARAILLAVQNPAAQGEVFNCGDEECLTLHTVVELIADEFDHDWEIVSMPVEIATPARPLMFHHRTTHRYLDLAKLRTLLGYTDAVPAREAVKRTARWLSENRPAPGGMEETVLEDPFDYVAEDELIASWRSALAAVRQPAYEVEPGLGLHYAGPGASRVRPDTRI